MPRTRIPNARFLANADSLLPLPFLAPCFSTPSPFAPINTLSRGKKCANIAQKKQDDGAYSGARHGVLALSSPRNLRYVDVFSYTHQQVRGYAATPKSTHESTHTIKSAERVQKAKVLHRSIHTKIRWVPSTPSDKSMRRRRLVRNQMQPTSRLKLPLLHLRRLRALATTRKRLQTMLSYEPHATGVTLMLKGRYRTLQRRIYIYSRTANTTLDMRQGSTDLRSDGILIKAFAAAARRLYPGTRRKSYPIWIRHDPQCKEWYSQIFRDTLALDEERVWRNWMRLELGVRYASWHVLLLYVVDCKPDRALQFLRVISRDPCLKTNPAILADTLEILARRYLLQKKDGRSCNRANFVPTFCHIFRQHLANIKHMCTQDLLLSIAQLAHAEDLKLVYDLIADKVFWGYDTLLHYANRFGSLGQHDYALLCLQKVIYIGRSVLGRHTVVARERFRWSCALILRESVSNGQNYHMTADIVSEFLNLGVKLDILLYNVIINNAIEAGDYKVAFQVYNLLEENGIKPDKRTYSIMLRGCAAAENPVMFRKFAEYCAKMALEFQDPWLASDCLYYEYVCHPTDKVEIEQLFVLIHRLYSQFFTYEPLEWMGVDYRQRLPRPALPTIGTMDSQNAPSPLSEPQIPPRLLEPPAIAIYLMLQIEIRRAMATSNSSLWELYLLFRNAVRSIQHPIIIELACKPMIWNAFLLAFCRTEQFANASHVIKAMPAPNVYSWNIFMQGFFKTSQVHAAERIFRIMQVRNVLPDQFTFGVLLRGYARAQRTERIGQVMDELDSEKQLHPTILQALARMRDRESLMAELEQSQKRKEVKQKERAREEEEDKMSRWELLSFSPPGKDEQHMSAKWELPSLSPLVEKPLVSDRVRMKRGFKR